MLNFPTGLKILEEASTALEVRCKDAHEEQTLQKADEICKQIFDDPSLKPTRAKNIFASLNTIDAKCSKQFKERHAEKLVEVTNLLERAVQEVHNVHATENGQLLVCAINAFLQPLTLKQNTQADSQAETVPLDSEGNNSMDIDIDSIQKRFETEFQKAKELLKSPEKYLENMIKPEAELFVSSLNTYKQLQILGNVFFSAVTLSLCRFVFCFQFPWNFTRFYHFSLMT